MAAGSVLPWSGTLPVNSQRLPERNGGTGRSSGNTELALLRLRKTLLGAHSVLPVPDEVGPKSRVELGPALAALAVLERSSDRLAAKVGEGAYDQLS